MKVKLLLLILGVALNLLGCGNSEPVGTTKAEGDYSFAFDMTNAFDSNFELDIENRYIMTGKDVGVRGIPDDSAVVNRTLSYQMVDVYAAAYVEDGKWVLIGFCCFDEGCNNMGWVKVSELMEYTEENYQLLRYPVKVKEGCVDLETGEVVKWDAWSVDYVEDYAYILREGGQSYHVDPDNIIYPSFEKKDKVLTEYSIQDSAQESKTDEEDHEEEILYEPNLEVISITEQRYEKNGSFIEFSDLPENDAETIVCHDLLGQIVGSSTVVECAKEWIKVQNIDTLELEELVECDDYHILFEQLWMKLAPDVTYDRYVKTILGNGCMVVSLKYTDKYTEEMNSKLPQLPDGEHDEFWLLVPTEDMYLEVFDNTRYYGAFNFYEGDVPSALYATPEKDK